MARSDDLEFIRYYIEKYKESADGDIIWGAYGPRLFGFRALNQMQAVIEVLRRRPDSRRAVIQLFDAFDLAGEHRDVPCTCTLQFLCRGSRLHMFSSMRSNDAFLGLPHDFFSFTMLQEIVARTLDVELGTYQHAVGSLHLYDRDLEQGQAFLDEGWQSTEMAMPEMPPGDPWHSIDILVRSEALIRAGSEPDPDDLAGLDSYWADIVRMLQVLRYVRAGNFTGAAEVKDLMSSHIYRPFIDHKIRAVANRANPATS